MKFIGTIIWTLAEHFRIDLGSLAPIVFGWMVGAKPVLKEKE